MKTKDVAKFLCYWHGIRTKNSSSHTCEKTARIKIRGFLSTLLLTSLLAAGLFGQARALSATIYVDADVIGGDGTGSSWANAFTSLSSAITAAGSGDEIWVKSGIYIPGAARTDTFTLKNGVSIYGGFAGTETLLTQRDPATNVTILSGDIDNNDSQTPIITDLATVTGNTTNSYHVVSGGGTDNTAVLDGFTVTAGNANSSNPNNSGGGMYNNNSSPALANLVFSGNTASYGGGGMYNYESSPTIMNLAFLGNSAGQGGGMLNMGNESSPNLMNVTFSGNSATSGNGGGMRNEYSSKPTLTNVTFSGNSATSTTSGGGGISNFYCTPTLINVTISGNSAGNNGGGMNNDHSKSTLTNVIIWGNTAPFASEIFNFYTPTTPLTITYSVIKGGYTGTGNVSGDPILGALANNGGYTHTMALGSGSSAIDAGTNTVCPATDQRGVSRPQGSQCDIGAYEYENAETEFLVFLPYLQR